MPWHFLLESLAYVVAFRIYVWARDRQKDFLDDGTRWSVILAAVAGAAIGSRVLFWLEDPARTAQHWMDPVYLLSGKTLVGALLGGTVAVESWKRRRGIRSRTGDLFAIPIAVGIAIGRIGCLLAGKADDTYGTATSLPWGIDLGDGVLRHPVQLYEVVAMILLVVLLARVHEPRFAQGDRFRVFLFAYFLWRVLVDFLKPYPRFAALSILQWVSLGAALCYAQDVWRIVSERSRGRERKEALAHG